MFSYEMQIHHKTAIFYLNGEMSLEETALLRKAFYNCMTENDINTLILDLSEVSTLDASTISLFVSAKNSMTKIKGELMLVAPIPRIYHVFERHNLHLYFDIRRQIQLEDYQEPAGEAP